MRWTPAIIATKSRLEGGEGKNEKGEPPQYLKCVDGAWRPWSRDRQKLVTSYLVLIDYGRLLPTYKNLDTML